MRAEVPPLGAPCVSALRVIDAGSDLLHDLAERIDAQT
jgi:hypothetical protein